MKITSEHYGKLSAAVLGQLAARPGIAAKYAEAGLSEKRFRWDLLWACNLSGWITSELYPYLNDDHIDSALRRILKGRL